MAPETVAPAVLTSAAGAASQRGARWPLPSSCGGQKTARSDAHARCGASRFASTPAEGRECVGFWEM